MAAEKVYIPREAHLQRPAVKRQVCKDAYDLLMKYRIIKIDKQNPILQIKPDLRRMLVLRRTIHKLYDMIVCDNWDSLINTGDLKEYKFLVLRDCYLTMDLLCEPEKLEQILNNFYKLLKGHIKVYQVS